MRRKCGASRTHSAILAIARSIRWPIQLISALATFSGCLAPDDTPDAAVVDAGQVLYTETEPNDGATVDQYNALETGKLLTGALQSPGDADIFKIDTIAGRLYRLTLTVPAGSSLQAHVTVFDTGRGGHAAGDDFVKVGVLDGSGSVQLEWLAMGQGGYFVAVRDQRNVTGSQVGGEGFGYELSANNVALAEAEVGALTFPTTGAHASLRAAGAVALYRFSTTSGTEVTIDLRADDSTEPAGLDGRLIVVSVASGDWVARNDDRGQTDVDPLLQAPLYADGEIILVVDNVNERATRLGYTLNATSP